MLKLLACAAAVLVAAPAFAAAPALVPPVTAALTSPYGPRVEVITKRTVTHLGQDYDAKLGTPIQAAAAGKVIFSGWHGDYGQTVIVDHGDGWTTLYGHADTLTVKVGESVKQGQAIATVGQSGLSSSRTHVHFELRHWGSAVNPAGYLKK